MGVEKCFQKIRNLPIRDIVKETAPSRVWQVQRCVFMREKKDGDNQSSHSKYLFSYICTPDYFSSLVSKGHKGVQVVNKECVLNYQTWFFP